MTYRDVIIQRNNLEMVNSLEGTNPKFTYAVSKNKRFLDSIIKLLDEIKKPSEKIEEYWRKLDEINKKHAETDESGTVLYTTITVDGQPRKAYKKVVGEGNPDSKYTKETEKLKKEFQADIDKYEKQVKAYNEMLDNELPEGELRVHWIDLEIVPAGLNQKGMDGCLPFIKDTDQPEEKPAEEKESKLKKT